MQSNIKSSQVLQEIVYKMTRYIVSWGQKEIVFFIYVYNNSWHIYYEKTYQYDKKYY